MADLNGIINLMILDVVDLQEANLIETSVRERVFSGIFSDPIGQRNLCMVYSGPARLVFRSVFSDFSIFYKSLFQWEGAPFF